MVFSAEFCIVSKTSVEGGGKRSGGYVFLLHVLDAKEIREHIFDYHKKYSGSQDFSYFLNYLTEISAAWQQWPTLAGSREMEGEAVKKAIQGDNQTFYGGAVNIFELF
jgi:hypothetical protein